MRLLHLKNESEHPIFNGADIRRLIWPLLLEQVLVMLVGLADTVMVSQVGETAVSGVSLVDMMNQLIFSILSALATGGAVITAQYIGKKRRDKAGETANQLLYAALLIGLVIMGLCIGLRGPMLRLFFGSIEPQVMEAALIYLVVSAVSYPFLAMYNAGAALFRSMGKSRVTLWVSLFMNGVNIVFNGVFIFGFQLGALGAGLGSLIARAAAALLINGLLIGPGHEIRYVKPACPWIRTAELKRILYIGIPSGLEGGVFQLGRILVVSIIATFGTTQIAANAVANNFDGIGVIPGNALMLAMITVVGQCVGAGEYQQAEYYTKRLMVIAIAAFLVWDSLILLTLPWTIQVYNLSADTLTLARLLVTIHNSCAIVLWPFSFVLPNALRAANDVKYPMAVSMFSMMVFRVLFSVILGQYFGMGAVGVWIAMLLDWAFRGTFFVLRFHGRKWQRMKLAE